MRIAIVEDEAVIARRLARMVGEIVGNSPIEVAPSLNRARALIQSRRIDLLFLDLNLNGEDGFRLLEEAAAAPFQTVVVSAHHDQALRAFEYGVTDFVAKPWTHERLRVAVERALRRDSAGRGLTRRLVVRRRNETRTIDIAQIVSVRGADDYSELRLADGSEHLHEKSLTALESLLPAEFARVHRSYIANFARAKSIRTTPREALVMDDGSLVPIGRVYRAGVREKLVQA
jgi:two-component system, LytTR family, response regulator LytT